MVLRKLFLFSLLALSCCQLSMGQVITTPGEDSLNSNKPGGAYCNVFYVTSFDTEVLPFDDVCFVVDEYSMGNAKYFRCIGPIRGTIDLFRSYPWSLQFHLPYVAEGERLAVTTPEDIGAKTLEMAPGEFFVTVSDNRDPERARQGYEQIDYATVKGKATITEYHPMEGTMQFPEYTAQMDLWMSPVTYREGKAAFDGPPIRVKLVLRVEALD